MPDILIWGLPVLAGAGSALWSWRRWHPVSFWYLVGFPLRALVVYGTWRAVAAGCGLTRRRRRWRWTFPTFPGFPGWEG